MVDLDSNNYVFFDMDGVMADFFPHFRKRFYHKILINKIHPLDINVSNYFNKKKIRDFVHSCCEEEPKEFWINIPRTNVSNFYMKRLKDYSDQILFLTATPPRMIEAVAGKKIWLRNVLNVSEDRVFFDENKEKYAVINGNRNILVDDSKENVDKFNAAGGLGLWELGKRSVASYYIDKYIIPILTEKKSLKYVEPITIKNKSKRPRIHRLDRVTDIWDIQMEDLNTLPEHCYNYNNE